MQGVLVKPVVTGFGPGEGIHRMDWSEVYTPVDELGWRDLA